MSASIPTCIDAICFCFNSFFQRRASFRLALPGESRGRQPGPSADMQAHYLTFGGARIINSEQVRAWCNDPVTLGSLSSLFAGSGSDGFRSDRFEFAGLGLIDQKHARLHAQGPAKLGQRLRLNEPRLGAPNSVRRCVGYARGVGQFSSVREALQRCNLLTW